MADLKEIEINGTVYNLKDETARNALNAFEASVSKSGNTATITITDAEGTTTATVTDGTATDAQVAAWLDAHPEATTTVADGSVTLAKLASDVAEETPYGIASDNVDILLNTLLTFTNYQYYNTSTGAVQSKSSNCCRSAKFGVKGGSTILLDKNADVVFFDKEKTFIIGYAGNGESIQTIEVPANAYRAGISSSTAISPMRNGVSGYTVKTNFRVTDYAYKAETLHVDAENVDGVNLQRMADDVSAVRARKYTTILDVAGIKADVQETVSESADIYMTKQPLHADETYDTTTGEVIEAVGGSRFDLMYTKPGSLLSIATSATGRIITVCFFTYSGEYLGFKSGNGTYTVPEYCYKVGICSPNFSIPTGDSPASYNYVKTNCFVSDIKGSFESNGISVSDLNGLGDVESIPSDMTRYLEGKTVKTQNQMRHAFRIASFNTYVGNRNRWTELKNFLQPYGIDIIGFQEVSQPLDANASGLTMEQALTSWHLSQFAIIQTEDVPTNCRPVAATDEFEVVSVEETKYTTQSNYGHRHFTKTQLKLPRWKDKKSSENFMISIYNTQLEVGTGNNNQTRLSQVNQLLAEVANDTNPFVVIMGDFNEMSTSMDTYNAIKNAGFTPQLTDTSTPTAGRGFYDFIFVNERMNIVGDDVIPYDLHNNISDHDLVFADVVFDYSNIIAVKTSLPNCKLTGGSYWLDRRQTEPVVYTVTADEGYTVSSIATGQGDNDLAYSNGAVVLSGNTVTVKPNLVVGDIWINVTTTANS